MVCCVKDGRLLLRVVPSRGTDAYDGLLLRPPPRMARSEPDRRYFPPGHCLLSLGPEAEGNGLGGGAGPDPFRFRTIVLDGYDGSLSDVNHGP